jgi:hypothetical protein
MAYPTVSAPYGFKPVNRIDGLPYAGAIQQIRIAGTYNTAIYNGDTVKVVAGGSIELSGATTSGTILGVFVGCQYTNAQGQTVQAQYYPGTSATNAVAYVVVDPSVAFRVALTTSGTPGTVTYANQTIVGANVATVYGTGSATTGDSGSSVVVPGNGEGAATTLPFRVIAVVPDTSYVVSGTVVYPEVIVKINNPQYTALTGTAYTA